MEEHKSYIGHRPGEKTWLPGHLSQSHNQELSMTKPECTQPLVLESYEFENLREDIPQVELMLIQDRKSGETGAAGRSGA